MTRMVVAMGIVAITLLNGSAAAVTPEPLPLNTNAASDLGEDEHPEVGTDGLGTWVAVWESQVDLGGAIGTDHDILTTRSIDNGASWTPPTPLNTNATTDSGEDEKPQITADGAGNWVAIWHSTDSLGGTIGTDRDILVSRSTNNGVSWTAPLPLNTNATTDSGSDSIANMATDGAGNWVVAWDSWDDLGGTIGTDGDILMARSTDNGISWTAPLPLNTNATTGAGSDQYPEIVTSGGDWVAVWYSSEDLGGTVGGDDDIHFARSIDNGISWTAPLPLNANATADGSSDSDRYPELATDGVGNWVAVWASDNDFGGTIGKDGDILVAYSADNAASWSTPTYLNHTAPGELGADEYPQVTTDADGNWVTVWNSSENIGGTVGTEGDVFMSMLTDNGANWTNAVPLNANASSDTGRDHQVQLTTDRAGNWIGLWTSGDSLGGTIGTDGDILYTNCSPLDSDCDAVPDFGPGSPSDDNCPTIPNPGQENSVHPGTALGDHYEDPEPDGVFDIDDNCPDVANGGQENTVHEGTITGDHCEDPEPDGVFDIADNCPDAVNAGQENADGDQWGDACDPCPTTASFWTVPPGDDDCDHWISSDETTIGTDPNTACGFTASGTQSEYWPPDLVENNTINIFDVLALKPVFGTAVPPTSARFDVLPGGGIDIFDVLAMKPVFGMSCTP